MLSLEPLPLPRGDDVSNLKKGWCRLHWRVLKSHLSKLAIFQKPVWIMPEDWWPWVVPKSWVAWPWRSQVILTVPSRLPEPYASHSSAAKSCFRLSPALAVTHHPAAGGLCSDPCCSMHYVVDTRGPWAARFFLSLEKCFSVNLTSMWYGVFVFVFRWKHRLKSERFCFVALLSRWA